MRRGECRGHGFLVLFPVVQVSPSKAWPSPNKKKKERNKDGKKKKKKVRKAGKDKEGAKEDLEETVPPVAPTVDPDVSAAWGELFVPYEVLLSLSEMGFIHPTPIQRAVLPAAIRGRVDIVGAAETGSGKTLAFGIPVLAGILADMDREKDKGSDEEEDKEEVKEDVEDSSSSEEEDDMSDDEAIGKGTGCVRVVNDVKFDFEEDPEEFIAPPLEILQEVGALKKASADSKLSKGGSGKLRALVLAPTRELAIQVKNHIEKAAKHTRIKVRSVKISVQDRSPYKFIFSFWSGRCRVWRNGSAEADSPARQAPRDRCGHPRSPVGPH